MPGKIITMATIPTQITINGTDYNVVQLSDDGQGNRLYQQVGTEKVVNERYNPSTGEHIEFNDDIEGWGYADDDSLI